MIRYTIEESTTETPKNPPSYGSPWTDPDYVSDMIGVILAIICFVVCMYLIVTK